MSTSERCSWLSVGATLLAGANLQMGAAYIGTSFALIAAIAAVIAWAEWATNAEGS